MIRTYQRPLFTPETEWVMPEELKSLKGHKEIAVDLETYDPRISTLETSGNATKEGKIIGVAVAVEGWSAYYPFGHDGGGNMDEKLVLSWLKELLSQEQTTFIFHNAMYDVGWLRAYGLEIKGSVVDTMIAAALVNENRVGQNPFSLNSLAKEYCGISKDEKVLRAAALEYGVNPKSEMWKLPSLYVGEYAEKDAEATLKLWQVLKIELSKEEAWSIFEMETKLLPCLLDMRFNGVRVDLDRADQVKKHLIKEEHKLLKKIKDITGEDIPLMAPRAIARVFDKLNIPYDRTELGAPSFRKNFLSSNPHELAQTLSSARELNKLHSNFIDNIIKFEVKGRIHADINQIKSDDGGTVTGRFSMRNPNLQQIPARHPELGAMIRSIFIPEKDCKWGVFDYSQQEPRILVHYAMLQKLEGVDEIANSYKSGEADFHDMVAKMAGIERSQAKTINLGLMYGMGKNKLKSELGLMDHAAEKLIKQYNSKVPFVKQLTDMVSRKAEQYGRIRTLKGRICRFDKWVPYEFVVASPLPLEEAKRKYGDHLKRFGAYKALNRLIQGSAADMTKMALIALHENKIIPHIQIHDEVDISIESHEQRNKVIEIMQNAVELKVPNKVDYEFGDNWGTTK
jgi:DNA polymerase I-like protein with 3'-5' exonuclease and polymerase domains